MGSCRQMKTLFWEKIYHEEATKKKVVQLDGSDDNSILDGSTTPQGFIAEGKTHLGSNNNRDAGTPCISHLAPVTRHQSASPGISQTGTACPGSSQPGTRDLITGHIGTVLPGTSQPGTGQNIASQPGIRLPGTG